MEFIGESAAIAHIRATIARVAMIDATIMISGESGCGKEVVARTLHATGRRAGAPFVAVNCAAIPGTLIEAELFGHRKGGFTGADRTREGVFERAGTGTLFLDEITEMPLEAQSRLLRVLETRTVQHVGGDYDIPVECRMIAATNRDPAECVRRGRLRADIYYRLAVLVVRLPPLRERPEDIEPLARHLLAELNQRYGTDKTFSRSWLKRLRECRWPGNVRELRNVVERAFVLCDDVLCLEPTDFDPLRHLLDREPAAAHGESIELAIGASLAQSERALILATLRHFEGNKRRAADVLGCSLKTLYNKLQEYHHETNRGLN